MTFKELKRLMEVEQEQQSSPEIEKLKARLYNKPFYIWDNAKHKKASSSSNLITHGNCCFNHIIGLPTKNGVEKPMFNYEKMLYDALVIDNYLNSVMTPIPTTGDTIADKQARNKLNSSRVYASFKNKHIAVLKAAGLGITEFVLRFIAWLCLRNDNLKGSQIILFTGPRIELSISLINRMKDFFKPHNIYFDDKETVLDLNGVHIEAFPSHHADSARGLPNVSLIFADEAAFFPKGEQDNVMDICLRNVPKSNPYLILVSTPQKPGDLMEQVMKERFETAPFKKLWLDWTYGIGKIYSQEDIDKIKSSRSFDREFCLKFAGVQGNVISPTAIDRVLELGESKEMSSILDNWNIDCQYIISLDPSWGSSNFAILVSRFINSKVQILYASEFERANFSDVISEIWRLKNKCASVQNIILDSANTEIYTALCHEFKQNPSLQYLSDKQAYAKKVNQPLENYLFICPVPFSTQGQHMLTHCKWLIEEIDDDNDNDGKALVSIDKRFDKLITSLKTAQAIENRLDKDATIHDDLFDALRLNLSFYRQTR